MQPAEPPVLMISSAQHPKVQQNNRHTVSTVNINNIYLCPFVYSSRCAQIGSNHREASYRNFLSPTCPRIVNVATAEQHHRTTPQGGVQMVQSSLITSGVGELKAS